MSLKQSGYANLIMNKHIHRQEWGRYLEDISKDKQLNLQQRCKKDRRSQGKKQAEEDDDKHEYAKDLYEY